jgi:sugar phosphate isomerase/epimerase
MDPIRRRDFLALAAAPALPLSARTLKTVGVQLYTVRSVIDDKPLGTLKEIEEIGYREVEVVAGNMEKIWPSLQQTKLRPVSAHLDTALFTRDAAKLPPMLDNVKQKGFAYAVCPYIAPQDRGGVEVIKKLAETLNNAGEICRKSGLQLCYHNHAFEFEPVREGGTLLDVLMKNADPKLVSLELDIMWSQVAGVDPVSVLKQYGRRVALMHLKNVSGDTGKRYNEQVPRTAFREVGNGVIDVAAVLKAADKAGVKHFFVEQDQTPGDPVASLRQSYEYLAKLNY